MTVQTTEPISKEHLDEYIAEAASAAHYENGFGIPGCDLSKPIWWAGYCRQSLDQQAQNNRLPEYLLTLAKMAKDLGVVVPPNTSSMITKQASTWNAITWRTCATSLLTRNVFSVFYSPTFAVFPGSRRHSRSSKGNVSSWG